MTVLQATEWLFSYGTLQLDSVQISTFGRKLEGNHDALPLYEKTMVKIEDPQVVATSGQTHHPIIKYSGNPADRVNGMVFKITPEELANANDYEVDAYKRVAVQLASGQTAWVYVNAAYAAP